MNQIDLKGRRAVVTGAAQGIGLCITQRLLASGAQVCLWDQDAALLGATCEELAGSSVFSSVVDVTDSGAVAAAAQQTASDLGGIDILVNNAGTTHRNQPMTEVTEEEYERIFAVNVKSVYLSARHVVPVMKKQGFGVILNVASTAGVRPRPGLVWYNTSKGAMMTATKAMAIELAGEKIRVNAINPVAGETGMLHLFMGEDTPEKRAQFISSIPLGRLSLPEDMANAALFLCSDEAEMITGLCMEVDGGRCI